MTRWRSLPGWLLILAASTATAIEEEDLLPPDEAFAISAQALGRDEISVNWNVAPDYYLYKSRISFKSLTEGVSLGEPLLPPGKPSEDEFFGLQETYRGSVTALLPIVAEPGVSRFELEAQSQGCADLGVCYPPHRQKLWLELPPSGGMIDLGLAGQTQPGSALRNALPGSGGVLDLGADQALPVDEAFRFETIALSGTELLARWTIAPGYYLYRDQIEFELGNASLAVIESDERPDGEAKTDEHFGATRVYYDQVEVPVHIGRASADAAILALTARYQGCKEAGICYPPVARTVSVALPRFDGPLLTSSAANAPRTGGVGGTAPVPEQDRLAQALGADTLITLLSFFGFGLLLSFTPCVFPMIPILSGIIAGQGDRISTRRAFTLSAIYVLAMALTYTAAGVIAGLFGQNLQAVFQNAWVIAAFSAVFVALALSMFGFYELALPSALQNRLNALSERQSTGTALGTAVMGVLSALIVGPCIAPPLAAALIYIGQTGDALLGGLALFALAMGMGVPLLIIGTSAGRFLPHAGPWMNAVKAVFGVLLLALAIWMLERIVDPVWVLLAWGILAIASGVYMGAFERLPDSSSGWARLWKALGLVLVLLGAMELIGAASGGRDWLQPLKGLGTGGGGSTTTTVTFQPVKSMADVQSAIATAGQPTLLDFYADWCVDCKRMDRYTFPEPVVQTAMASGLALKADVTANDEIDQQLMRSLGVIGPPVIVFFDARGNEMPQWRVIGYQRPEAFARHVAAAFEAGR